MLPPAMSEELRSLVSEQEPPRRIPRRVLRRLVPKDLIEIVFVPVGPAALLLSVVMWWHFDYPGLRFEGGEVQRVPGTITKIESRSGEGPTVYVLSYELDSPTKDSGPSRHNGPTSGVTYFQDQAYHAAFKPRPKVGDTVEIEISIEEPTLQRIRGGSLSPFDGAWIFLLVSFFFATISALLFTVMTRKRWRWSRLLRHGQRATGRATSVNVSMTVHGAKARHAVQVEYEVDGQSHTLTAWIRVDRAREIHESLESDHPATTEVLYDPRRPRRSWAYLWRWSEDRWSIEV